MNRHSDWRTTITARVKQTRALRHRLFRVGCRLLFASSRKMWAGCLKAMHRISFTHNQAIINALSHRCGWLSGKLCVAFAMLRARYDRALDGCHPRLIRWPLRRRHRSFTEWSLISDHVRRDVATPTSLQILHRRSGAWQYMQQPTKSVNFRLNRMQSNLFSSDSKSMTISSSIQTQASARLGHAWAGKFLCLALTICISRRYYMYPLSDNQGLK